jgi:hypothetical protein
MITEKKNESGTNNSNPMNTSAHETGMLKEVRKTVKDFTNVWDYFEYVLDPNPDLDFEVIDLDFEVIDIYEEDDDEKETTILNRKF